MVSDNQTKLGAMNDRETGENAVRLNFLEGGFEVRKGRRIRLDSSTMSQPCNKTCVNLPNSD